MSNIPERKYAPKNQEVEYKPTFVSRKSIRTAEATDQPQTEKIVDTSQFGVKNGND